MVKIGALETAMRGRDIVARSFPIDKRNAKHVAIASFKTTPKGWAFTTLTKVRGERVRRHKQEVAVPPGYTGTFNACKEIRCDCDCMRHQFVWNYALIQRDAAIWDRTNGEPPVVTNPGEIPGCCKHLVVCMRLLASENPRWTPPATFGTRIGLRKPIKLTDLHATIKSVRTNKI